ncbi:MAG: HAMP domain-containing histidine kinase [Bacteroidetes bacterium]|nr:HAMP domain-containing histidine kinase [Bacteroidota bacterium]
MKFLSNQSFIKRKGILLIGAAWLLTFSFIINNYWSSVSGPNAVKNIIQKDIYHQENKVQDFLNDSIQISRIIRQNYSTKRFDNMVNFSFFVFCYRGISPNYNAPIFWNTPVVMPDSSFANLPVGKSFRKLVNGWYVIIKSPYQDVNKNNFQFLFLIPVKWDYYIENKYLQNSFVAIGEQGNNYSITERGSAYPVKLLDGNTIFYINQIGVDTTFHDNTYALWLRILAAFLLLFFIHTLASEVVKNRGFIKGVTILVSSLVLLRLCSYFLPQPFNFRQLELFQPNIYSLGFLLDSLGDLLISSVLFIWVVLFIRYHFSYDFYKIKFPNAVVRYSTALVIVMVMILATFFAGNIIRSLVADPKISFDVINFFSLNIYSVFGFIVLSSLAIGYFFLIQILLQPLKIFLFYKKYYLYFFITFCGLIILTLRPHSTNVSFNLLLLLWLLLFVFLLNFKALLLQAYNLVSSKFIFWVFFFCVSITAIIIWQNRIKELNERKHFAENLANKADPSGPVVMNILLTDFRNEYLSDIFYRFYNPLQNRILKDSLINENFSGYLDKFDTRIYTFDPATQPLYNDDSTNFNSLNTIISTQGKTTGFPDLYYYDVSYDRFSYISKKEITDTTGKNRGYIFIVSTPKKYKTDALYPELFSKGGSTSLESSTVYAFAIYVKNKLSTSYNDYPFSTIIDNNTFLYNEFRTVNKNGYEELWYRANGDKVIVIARQDRFFVESLTLFAYLFCSFLGITVFFNLVNQFLTDRKKRPDVKSFWQFTIRNQVHGTIIMISLFSFIVIGVTTILFFIGRYHSNNREKLSRTIHVMEGELRNTFDTLNISTLADSNLSQLSKASIAKVINSVSAIHATDINLYDLNGNLKVSSVPLLYDKGIVSSKMDPVAFYYISKLRYIQFFQEQKIGNLNYLSNYLPVRNDNGKEFAYLNIPYFESQSKLQDEISNFLVTIINLNAFIFLMGGVIALFITNRITESFSLISGKMKKINLQTGNEQIEWKRKDEIGDLVDEYNKMVMKLDVSAQMLARSEREGAWREMARQVAHEIKNPLTPMKLNLQYLQMAIDNNSPDVRNISLYVAKIILEQIEHLSQIAGDFGQFANIGNANIQIFDLNLILKNVIILYATNDEITINEHLLQQEIFIKADRTQINRLFTNLLQNAVQSVPDFRSPLIEIENKIQNDTVIVAIRDNGIGINESMRAKIFTPNFTTKSSGTGLGLAMCKGIIENANGNIWFETKEGEWTIFYVELPVYNGA